MCVIPFTVRGGHHPILQWVHPTGSHTDPAPCSQPLSPPFPTPPRLRRPALPCPQLETSFKNFIQKKLNFSPQSKCRIKIESNISAANWKYITQSAPHVLGVVQKKLQEARYLSLQQRILCNKWMDSSNRFFLLLS